MSARQATPRTIRRALDVLLQLPAEALGALAERLIERLDAAEPDPDLEPDDDCCAAGDDDPASSRPCQGGRGLHFAPGEPDDAEPDGDNEAGPDDEGPWWAPMKGPVECCPVRLAAG